MGNSAIQLPDGNYVFIATNYNDYNTSAVKRTEIVLVKVDPEGKILKTRNVASPNAGESYFSPLGVDVTQGDLTLASGGKIWTNTDGTFDLIYNGYLPRQTSADSSVKEVDKWAARLFTYNEELEVVGDEFTYTGTGNDFHSSVTDRNGRILHLGVSGYTNEGPPTDISVTIVENGAINNFGHMKVPSSLSGSNFTQPNVFLSSLLETSTGFVGVLTNKSWLGNVNAEYYYVRWGPISGANREAEILSFEQVSKDFKLEPILSNGIEVIFSDVNETEGIKNKEYYRIDDSMLPSSVGKNEFLFKTGPKNEITFIYNPVSLFGVEFDYYGTFQNVGTEFLGYNVSDGIIMGSMDENLNIKSAVSLDVGDSVIYNLQLLSNRVNNNKLFM